MKVTGTYSENCQHGFTGSLTTVLHYFDSCVNKGKFYHQYIQLYNNFFHNATFIKTKQNTMETIPSKR